MGCSKKGARCLGFVLLAVLVAFSTSAWANDFTLSFNERTYIPSTDDTEYSYTLCWNGNPPGLSHLDLGVPVCQPGLDVVAGGDPFEGCGSPEDPAIDNSTDPDGPQGPELGFFGIKWPECSFGGEDCSSESPCCETFSVLIDGNHGTTFGLALAKAGNCNFGGENPCDLIETTVPSCETGNLPPTCDAGGPYEVPCGDGTGTVQLQGSGSDPDGDPGSSSSFWEDDDDDSACSGVTYSWTTNCPGGSFDDPSSPTPQLTFNTEHPVGVPLSCTATLTVTDCERETSECVAFINVGDCTFDCEGTLNGEATFDDCGVCEGGNEAKDDCGVCFGENQDLDECGVCFGLNQDKDQCGVCFGDNSTCADCAGSPNGSSSVDDCGVCGGNNSAKDSCGVCFGNNSTCTNVCQETVITETLFALDGLGFEYLGFIKNLSKKLKKAGGNKKAGSSEVAQAEALYLSNWNKTWSIPEVIKSNCLIGEFCVTISNVPTIQGYEANHAAFSSLASKLIKQLKNLGLSTKKLSGRQANLDAADDKLTDTIPASSQDCVS